MHFSYLPLIAFALALSAFAEEITATPLTANPTSAPQPAYQPDAPASPSYVPHATYPFSDTYGGYLYPVQNYPTQEASNYMSAIMPAAQTALTIALRLFAKVGLFLMGGVSLLIVGGIFTTAVCSLTPLCTITFAGLNGIDRESMRSFMTPDKISAAAALVQEAIGKYQRLQRPV